jgi:hypothetical protein
MYLTLIVAPLVASPTAALVLAVPPSDALNNAVVVCEETDYGDVAGFEDGNGFFLLDEGSALFVQDTAVLDVAPMRVVSNRFACLAEQLGLPEWVAVRMAMLTPTTEVTVNGYRITWTVDQSGRAQFLFVTE